MLITTIFIVLIWSVLEIIIPSNAFINAPQHRKPLHSLYATDWDKAVQPASFTGRGSVILCQPGETDRFFTKSVILITEYSERGTVGAIINKPTAFTMGEMSPGIGVFEPNALFMGGNQGSDTAIMLHPYELGGFSKNLGNGLYLGGMREAKELVENFKAKPRDFKFVFNTIEWPPGAFELQIETKRWDFCTMSPELICGQTEDVYGTLWSSARNQLRKTGSLVTDSKEYEDE